MHTSKEVRQCNKAYRFTLTLHPVQNKMCNLRPVLRNNVALLQALMILLILTGFNLKFNADLFSKNSY